MVIIKSKDKGLKSIEAFRGTRGGQKSLHGWLRKMGPKLKGNPWLSIPLKKVHDQCSVLDRGNN